MKVADARRVALERGGDQVEHELAVLFVAGWLLGRGFFQLQRLSGLPGPRPGGRGLLDTLLDRTHDREVFVHALAVAGSEFAAQPLGIVEHAVEQQLVHFRSVACRRDTGLIQPLISGARVQLAWQRRVGIRPGDMRAVDARVSDREVDADGHRRDAELDRGERCAVAGALGGELVHRGAVGDIDAGRLLDRRAGEDRGLFRIVAVAAFRARVPEITEDQNLVLQVRRAARASRRVRTRGLRPFGYQCAVLTPFGIYSIAMRTGLRGAPDCARAAGIIASSQGRPSATPAPRSSVLRLMVPRVLICSLPARVRFWPTAADTETARSR